MLNTYERTGKRREVRAIRTEFKTREENDGYHICGYFAVLTGCMRSGLG